MAENRGLCPFLSLPLEMRNPIYSYLLSTEHTREDMIERIAISDNKYKGYYYRPAHTYHFQPAILRCNRQINEEATAVFHNTNLFVSISHNYSRPRDSLYGNRFDPPEKILKRLGFPILARGRKAQSFKDYAMEIHLGKIGKKDPPGMWWNSSKPQQWKTRPKFMIASDDLLEFCKEFLHVSLKAASQDTDFDTMMHLERVMLLVDVLHTTDQHNSANECLRPAARKLLEPLCYLHNIGLVIIEGPVPKLYIEAIRQQIQRQAPRAEDLVLSMSSLKEQGNAAFLNGDFRSAASLYETALDELHGGHQRHARGERMVEGRYTGRSIGSMRHMLHHRLLLGLAKANLKLQNYGMAHRWTLNVVYGFKDRNGIISQMWYYRALASKELGEFKRAFEEMQMARLKRPNDLGILVEIAALRTFLVPRDLEAVAD